MQRYEALARSVGMGDEAWHRQVPMFYSASRPYTTYQTVNLPVCSIIAGVGLCFS